MREGQFSPRQGAAIRSWRWHLTQLWHLAAGLSPVHPRRVRPNGGTEMPSRKADSMEMSSPCWCTAGRLYRGNTPVSRDLLVSPTLIRI